MRSVERALGQSDQNRVVFLCRSNSWIDPQAHEGNVLHNHRGLNVHSHEEKAESCGQGGKAESQS